MTTLEFPSEKFIEDYVYSEAIAGQCPVSGRICDHVISQVNLGDYGVADVIKMNFYSNKTVITVLELKNNPIKAADFAQLARYMIAVDLIIKKYTARIKGSHEVELFGELAGPIDGESHDIGFLAELIGANINLFHLSLSMKDGFLSHRMTTEELKSGRNNHKRVARKIYDCRIECFPWREE